MRTPRSIPSWAYAVAVVLTTVAYGASYVVIKDAMEAVATSWLLAMRFGLAALVLGVAFRRRIVRTIDLGHVLAGVVVGLPEALGFLLQNLGLTQTSPGRNAFLTATYCVMVPFLNWAFLRRRPGANSVVAALLCLTGVGFLALSGERGFGLGFGDVVTLVSSLFFALNIVAVGRFGRAHDAMVITTVMFALAVVLCTAVALVAEPVPDFATLTPRFWGCMAYVVLGSTVTALLLQNVGQRHVPPAQAALLLSLESVFAVLFSIVFYGEKVTPPLMTGFVLIFVAITVSQFGLGPLARAKARD